MGSKATLPTIFLTLLLAAPAYPHQADVELIPPGRYVEVALREIEQAKSSIHLIMYLIALPLHDPDSPVHRLLDALVSAKERGVAVRVVLDQNFDWDQGPVLGSQPLVWKNRPAARYMEARGIPVVFDDETTLTHAKALVIDRKTVIVGSTNWSEVALTRNVEATALIRSAAFARDLLESVVPRGSPGPAPGDERGVPVPWAFLGSRAWLGRMASAKDEGAFDLVLHLVKTFGGWRGGSQVVGYEPLAAALGVQGRVERERRKAVWNVLYRLQHTYGLLTVEIRRNQEPVITLTALPPTTPDDPVVRVPAAYWEWGWDRQLPLPGKVLYLLARHYATISPTAPVWFRSQADLAAAHGFAPCYAQDGLMILRRRNLLEVQPGPLAFGQYADRPANRYRVNPLYDPALLAQQVAALDARYGKAAVTRAKAYAALVYEDSDVQAIEQVIQLEEALGPAVVRAAARKVGALHGNNPKRTMAYLIGTIEGMGRAAPRD